MRKMLDRYLKNIFFIYIKKMDLRKGDCLKILPEIEEKSIDLFLLDLPYGQTACKWDSIIDLKELWVQIKRTMKPNAVIVFFCTTKFGYKLIQSNEKWFRYDLIWEKSRKVGFLSANKMPLRKHENVYIFSESEDENGEIAEYSKKVLQYIGKPKSHIKKEIPGADHFFRYSKDNFSLCTEDTYNKLIESYKIDKMEGFLEYAQLSKSNKYNPQMAEGKPYKTKESDLTSSYYRDGKKEYKSLAKENKGDRHPTSILPEFKEHENIYVFKDKGGTYNPQKIEGEPYYKGTPKGEVGIYNSKRVHNHNEDRHPTSILPEFEKEKDLGMIQGGYYRGENGKPFKRMPNDPNSSHPTSILPEFETTILKHKNPSKSLHKTQKPVSLCEWLIKTYSNEGDLVCDFTMGSGTTGVACKNTNRKFLGIEMDDEIFDIACKRINEE